MSGKGRGGGTEGGRGEGGQADGLDVPALNIHTAIMSSGTVPVPVPVPVRIARCQQLIPVAKWLSVRRYITPLVANSGAL